MQISLGFKILLAEDSFEDVQAIILGFFLVTVGLVYSKGAGKVEGRVSVPTSAKTLTKEAQVFRAARRNK